MPLKSAPLIEKIKAKVASTDPNSDRKALFVYLINITEDGKQVAQYTLDLKQLKASEGPFDGTPDVTITIEDQTLVDLGLAKISPEDAVVSGKMKLEGDQNGIKVMKVLVDKFVQSQKA